MVNLCVLSTENNLFLQEVIKSRKNVHELLRFIIFLRTFNSTYTLWKRLWTCRKTDYQMNERTQWLKCWKVIRDGMNTVNKRKMATAGKFNFSVGHCVAWAGLKLSYLVSFAWQPSFYVDQHLCLTADKRERCFLQWVPLRPNTSFLMFLIETSRAQHINS